MPKKPSRAAGAAAQRRKPPVPLGQLSIRCGDIVGVEVCFKHIAQTALFTRKVAALSPAMPPSSGVTVQGFASRLVVQPYAYELHGVSVPALGDEAFASKIKANKITCLSKGRGLDVGNTFAILPTGMLVAAVDGPTFERLGLETPAPNFDKLQEKLLVAGRRHVTVRLGLSNTRKKQASAPGFAVSHWREVTAGLEPCALSVVSEKGPVDFSHVLTRSGEARRVEIPECVRSARLGDFPGIPKPDFQRLVSDPSGGNSEETEVYCEACEDLMDWVGAAHLGLSNTVRAGSSISESRSDEEDIWLWSLGEGAMGAPQILHAFSGCLEHVRRGAPWSLLSFWHAEDAPISDTGGAHDFDLCGAQHAHVLISRGPEGADDMRCLMLHASNAQVSAAA